MEKIITYAAGVWGGSLTAHQKKKLLQLQRIYLIKISKAYKTSPTDALCVLLGIPPVYLVVEALYKKFNFIYKKKNLFNNLKLDVQDLDRKTITTGVPIENRIFNSKDTLDTEYEIYTDGSRMDGGVGAAFVVIQNGKPFQIHQYQLRSVNSVFQAEMLAIHQAVEWLEDAGVSANIFTDSASSIAALSSVKTKSILVMKYKNFLNKNRNIFSLNWTRAHSGTYGNELADVAAKEAIISGFPTFLPAPLSVLDRTIRSDLSADWQLLWDFSAVGRRAHGFVPVVDAKLQITHPSLIHFMTGHGPFASYLHRFGILRSPLCICGSLGDPDHYLFNCTFTSDHHLDEAAYNRSLGPNFYNKFLKGQPDNINKIVNVLKICNALSNTPNNGLPHS